MSDGFVDNEKLQQLIERIKTVYLEMGLTMVGVGVSVDEHGDPVIQTAAVVRETAYEQLSQDLEVRKIFAKQMAEEHQQSINHRIDAIMNAADEGRLMDVLTGDAKLIECSHERIHEGLCLDCNEEIDE